jgi:biopolymer transport protein ExbB
MSLLSFTQSLGFLEVPLVICSIIACIITLERFLILLRFSTTSKLMSQGVALVGLYSSESRTTRSEIASLWLSEQQKKLSSGLRLLNLIVLIAPLLGLLGTVIGLIQAFTNISLQPGPVEVATLADGLSLAMTTTAAGLLIAIPFMTVAHLYSLWIDRLLSKSELQMNKKNLSIDNIDIMGIKI